MRFIQLLWITIRPGRAWIGSEPNKYNPSTKLDQCACISSRITTAIHVFNDNQISYNCFTEPFAVLPYGNLYWDMHGLIFETSIWLLAGSTRVVQCSQHRAIVHAHTHVVPTSFYDSGQMQSPLRTRTHHLRAQHIQSHILPPSPSLNPVKAFYKSIHINTHVNCSFLEWLAKQWLSTLRQAHNGQLMA